MQQPFEKTKDHLVQEESKHGAQRPKPISTLLIGNIEEEQRTRSP